MEHKKTSETVFNDVEDMFLPYDKILNVSRESSVLKENEQMISGATYGGRSVENLQEMYLRGVMEIAPDTSVN
ncbi:MAG: hypothetical protein U5N56_08310 [Candidatus Marinimicrobia bacterium]|nr:hypothetical protein [Candidatus Neomarinimicrobiota bacterium]